MVMDPTLTASIICLLLDNSPPVIGLIEELVGEEGNGAIKLALRFDDKFVKMH